MAGPQQHSPQAGSRRKNLSTIGTRRASLSMCASRWQSFSHSHISAKNSSPWIFQGNRVQVRPAGKQFGINGLHDNSQSIRTRIEQIPLEERPQATAFIEADIRKANGGNPRVRLATWVGTDCIEAFFSKARIAWKALPKEWDETTGAIPIEPTKLNTFKKP